MKKIITLLGAFTLLLSMPFLFTSCEDTMEMRTEHFHVDLEEWIWNDVYLRYECVKAWDAIDDYMYDRGIVTAGVYLTEVNEVGQRYDVLRSLPFVHTYSDRTSVYTQTIGYDIGYGEVAFYIQASDLTKRHVYLGDYKFKISLLWEE